MASLVDTTRLSGSEASMVNVTLCPHVRAVTPKSACAPLAAAFKAFLTALPNAAAPNASLGAIMGFSVISVNLPHVFLSRTTLPNAADTFNNDLHFRRASRHQR